MNVFNKISSQVHRLLHPDRAPAPRAGGPQPMPWVRHHPGTGGVSGNVQAEPSSTKRRAPLSPATEAEADEVRLRQFRRAEAKAKERIQEAKDMANRRSATLAISPFTPAAQDMMRDLLNRAYELTVEQIPKGQPVPARPMLPFDRHDTPAQGSARVLK